MFHQTVCSALGECASTLHAVAALCVCVFGVTVISWLVVKLVTSYKCFHSNQFKEYVGSIEY